MDSAYFSKPKFNPGDERKPITPSLTFSSSAKKKMSKILDLWLWSVECLKCEFSFITLTLSSKADRNINHYSLLKKWLSLMIERYGDFNYCWKAELQSNGNLHYHLIIDRNINWKVVRKCWNKAQSVYVDRYQIKMKSKYKNGFFYDEKMLTPSGEIIDYDTQLRRYKIGYKANWRNPNSTDTKHPETLEEVKGYVSKYINKKEEDTIDKDGNVKRWWGCNKELHTLRYPIILEGEISPEIICLLKDNALKEVKVENQTVCTIIDKLYCDIFIQKETNQLTLNRSIIIRQSKTNEKLISKDSKQYDMVFGQ